eukprot:g2199.t1
MTHVLLRARNTAAPTFWKRARHRLRRRTQDLFPTAGVDRQFSTSTDKQSAIAAAKKYMAHRNRLLQEEISSDTLAPGFEKHQRRAEEKAQAAERSAPEFNFRARVSGGPPGGSSRENPAGQAGRGDRPDERFRERLAGEGVQLQPDEVTLSPDDFKVVSRGSVDAEFGLAPPAPAAANATANQPPPAWVIDR